ncbi:BTAD domain-containing putative transcriptional regulator [Lentzea sp. NPDC005914]|uniref:AfsR/SARP family transcriptional regulator n=1 Tax=Lentzea sp. NPDC005914 TaxID=3154572 RepID=UPI0033C1EC84
MTVEYRVLGPLEVLHHGEPVAVAAGRGRVLLATLLLRANEFVSVDELVDRVWEGTPPAGERVHKTLQMTVSRLRQAMGEANCIVTSSRGYSASVALDRLDLARFRSLTAQGEHRAALELWRGPVLANVASESLHRDDVPRLNEELVVALESRIDQDLRRDTDALVPELRSLVKRYPLRETFWAQLMLALHRSNRQAEALAVYQEIRDHLADELGVDPGPRLREAHQQVLSGEVPTVAVPRQLLAGVPHFVGREHELARLSDMLVTRPGEPIVISAINGIGGVGKTALALQWAHEVADRFPDGQLYVNLRGFDTRAEPLDPLTVIRDFLRAFGMQEVPSSDDALVAAYRSALAERRTLLVLDNARDAEQVRPLLPGGPGNLVLITSRNRLGGLVAREGAQPVALDVLDDQGAADLLTERIGAARIAAEPEAVSRLVERCAGLPLALGIVAARATFGNSLTALADELEQERLDALDLDDSATGVRAVFSWSLRSVSEAAARVFVLLGLHPGPDFAISAAASLAAMSLAETRKALNELVANSLVHTSANGRFGQHDLLRDYAAECAAELPEDQRDEASRRMYDHYVHSSVHSWHAMQTGARWQSIRPQADGAVVDIPAHLDAANDWFLVEQEVLLRATRQAVATGEDEVAWQLAFSLHLTLLRGGHLTEAEAVETLGLAAAERVGDVWGQARLHRGLAAVHIATRSLADAEFHLREALRREISLGDLSAEMYLSTGLAWVFEVQGRHADTLEVLRQLEPRVADLTPFSRASLWAALGRAHHRTGEIESALELCLRARAEYESIPGINPEVAICTNHETLGDIYLDLGRIEEAVACFEESVRLLRVMRSTHELCGALVMLAKALVAGAERDRAEECLQEAEYILGQREDATAEELRAQLEAMRAD